MKVKISYKRVVDRIVLPDAPIINITLLAAKLGVSKSRAHDMVKTGYGLTKHLERLREIPLIDVLGRHPYTHKKTEKGRR